MSKPTPIPTAQRALATAIKALENISISTGIKGTAIKLGNEFVTDTEAVVSELKAVKADAQELVNGLQLMLSKLAENTKPSQPLTAEEGPANNITATELIHAELESLRAADFDAEYLTKAPF